MRIITQRWVLLLWMYTLTIVKSQGCTREEFINGNLFDSNFDISDMQPSYLDGKQLRVGCNIGYSGFFKLLCIEGKWQSKGTKCQPRSCGHPGDAQFADFHLEKGDDFVFGSQVVYTCHKGYQMISRKNYRTCMAEGWDSVVPVCEAQRCPPINVEENVQVTGDTEEATYGNVVRFSCKPGNVILQGAAEVYCDENGVWSADPPKCEAVKCKPPVIENGFVLDDIQEYKENDFLNFDCKNKYQRTEVRDSKCIKIGMRAEWSPTPACELIKCRLTLPPLSGTRYEPAFKNVFLPGESVTVTCGQRHWIFNSGTLTVESICQDDGQWSVTPICQEVTCTRQDPYVSYWSHWRNTIKLDETVSYTCQQGYKSPRGANWARCTRDGWDPDPLCQEIICDRPDIENAAITYNKKDKYRNNEQVTIDCNKGFIGRFTLRCRERGWDRIPRCEEITCDPPNYHHTDVVNKKQKYKYNEQIHFVCRDGYKGNFSQTCMERGWTGEAGCTAITCERLVDPDANIERNPQEVYRYNDEVKYVCKTSRRHYYLTCKEEGWSGSPQCKDVCPKAEVENGFVVGPYNDTVYYTCNEDYKLVQGWWGEAKCNGIAWVGLQQCIKKTDCFPPDIPNGHVTPQLMKYEQNETVQIDCNEGYSAELSELTCDSGKWNSDKLKNICKRTGRHCGPPLQVENAVVMAPYQNEYEHGFKTTYQCHSDFKMVGKGVGKITCKNKNWTKINFNCTEKDCTHPDIPNGEVTSQRKKIHKHNQTIQIRCDGNHDVVDELTCDRGRWNQRLGLLLQNLCGDDHRSFLDSLRERVTIEE